MRNRTRTGIVFLLFAQGLAGCDGSARRPPLGPTPGPPLNTPAALAVTAVAPKTGLVGDQVTISGTGFSVGATVTLGDRATNVSVFGTTRITATTSANSGGTVDVVVTNPNGETATLSGAYTFGVVSLTASSTLVTSGGSLSVTWVAPSGRSGGDWVGLFRVTDPNTSYENGWWRYTDDVSSGTLTLSAPTEPGQYEFRYLPKDGFVDVARAPVTVSAGGD